MSTPPLWSVGRAPLPTLVGTVRADVCVIGLGGGGLSALQRLVAAGRTVVGLDARGVAAGATGRNGGFLLAGPARFHHHLAEQVGADAARRFYELTLETRDALMMELSDARPIGSFRKPHDVEERHDLERQLDTLHRDGFEATHHNVDGCEGLLIPGDGVFDPAQRCAMLAERVADHAQLYGGSPALEIETERVRTPHGEVRAEAILVCVDGHLERVLPSLAEAQPGRPAVRSLRLQMLATAPALDVRVEHAVYARNGYDYWQQCPDGRLALGGGRDIGGDDEWTTEEQVSETVQAYLDQQLRETIGTAAPVTHRWAGIVAYTDDDLPLVDAYPEIGDGVFVAGGYSGHGNVLSTRAGQSVAELALGRPTPTLPAWLRQVRQSPEPSPT